MNYKEMRRRVFAEDWMTIDAFIAEGGEIDSIRDSTGKSLIWHAMADGREQHAEALLVRGASPEEGFAGLLLHGNIDDGLLSMIFANKIDLRKQLAPCKGKTLLHLACFRGWDLAAQKMLEKDPGLARALDAEGISPLSDLIKNFREPIADSLLAAGAEIDSVQGKQKNSLAHQAVYWRSLSALLWLQKVGASLEEKNALGETPLFRSVSLGRGEICEALLDAGANPNEKNAKGRSPLFEAVAKGQSEIARLLLSRGADPSAKSGKNGQGRSPASLAGKSAAGKTRKEMLPALEAKALEMSAMESLASKKRRSAL